MLLLETSEEMPSDQKVFRMLRNFGERGLLEQFPAVLVGTAKSTFFSIRDRWPSGPATGRRSGPR